MNRNNNGIPVLYRRKEECCGCSACFSVCLKKAITMQTDEKGFEYPVIDESLCVHCYMCLRVCPIKAEHQKFISNDN